MDIRFLQSLLAVIETGSITGAARREKLTPAAISQRIQALERSLNCKLFSRGAHSIQPTETCLALLPRARILVRESAHLMDDALDGDLRGEVKIGAISTVLTGLLPAFIRETARQAPDLKLRLVPGSSLYLFEQLLAGALDIAILVEPPFALPKSLVGHTIRSEPLVYMTRAEIVADDVLKHAAGEPFIRYDPVSWGGRIVGRYMETFDLSPDVVCDLDALETIAILVAQGLGNALVPAWQGLVPTGFNIVSVSSGTTFSRNIVLLHETIPARPKAVAFLLELLQPDDH